MQNITAGILPPVKNEEERNIGDIYLGVEFIKERCDEEQKDFYGTITVAINFLDVNFYNKHKEYNYAYLIFSFVLFRLLKIVQEKFFLIM